MVKLNDNSSAIISKAKKARSRALTAIGMTAEGHAKEIITSAPAVDTGRLRNSITWATKENEGTVYPYSDDLGNPYTEQLGSGAADDEVFIGTNVEYASGIENGTHRKAGAVHFLRGAATGYGEEYEELTKQSFENA